MSAEKPEPQLIAEFGDVWCIEADPAALPIPLVFSPVDAVSVNDKDILIGGTGRFVELLHREAGNQNFSVRRSSKDGLEYFTFNLSAIPLVPTIMISDRWLAACCTLFRTEPDVSILS